MACQIPGSEFTLEATHEVAEKIVSRCFFQCYFFKLIKFGKDELVYMLYDLLVEKYKDGIFSMRTS